MMKLIVATDRNWGIGKDGGLLCHLSGDLAFFKEKTTGAAVVMGRKTLESLPGAKPLPGRRNIVITRSMDYEKEGCEIVHSLDELKQLLKEGEQETFADGREAGQGIFVIGGAEIYESLLPMVDTAYVTRIDEVFDADRFFPNLDKDPDFEVMEESDVQEENGIKYRFVTYERKA